jgi:transposase-like protein
VSRVEKEVMSDRKCHEGRHKGAYRRRPSSRKMIEATCPRCGKEHWIRVYWSGSGRPRLYCPLCRSHVGSEAGGRH